jgi:hypothetical protein
MVRGSPMFDMRRREFITLLGGAAAWPLAASGQQSAMPVIGLFRSGLLPERDATLRVTAFHQGMKESGYAKTSPSRIARPQVADLLRRQVALIVGNTPRGSRP